MPLGPHEENSSGLAALDIPDTLPVARIVAPLETALIELAAPLGISAGAPQLSTLLHGESQRLLAVDMPPGGKRRQGVGKMLVRGVEMTTASTSLQSSRAL